MITRWRIEAESPDKEEVEEEIAEATELFMGQLRFPMCQDTEWECTDEHGPEPVDRDGEAVFYMRRVFKVYEEVDNGKS